MSTGSGDRAPARGWGGAGESTTLLLVRHGVTAHTVDKRFSGGLASADPPLSEEGVAQARATAAWLAPSLPPGTALVTSPVRRTRETAAVLAETWDSAAPSLEHGFAEMEFGAWDGLTFAEVREQHGADLDAWLGRVDAVAGGHGESFAGVRERVLEGLGRTLAAHRGRTAVVVSHVTPIKVLVAEALAAPLEAVFRMELAPASLTVVSYHADADGGPDRPSLRLYNARPTGAAGPVA
ncbi:hypothetical protein GCM10009737_34110 [Nocardioides lentus]|uniref:Histidine phosphatase family protein n=1 Tax=Nocardioides lentus TaxID=338077 RepID=A0ABP5B3E9_9ACTN